MEKKFEGKRIATFTPPYKCQAVGQAGSTSTMRGTMGMAMSLNTGGITCDPLASLIPNDSVLTANGTVIRRNDAFAQYSGKFAINAPTGATLFTGWIETIDRLGSHHAPANCETCNPTSHFEGWLVGKGSGALANYTIRAQISSKGTVPDLTNTSQPISGNISGTFVRCP